MNAYTIISTLTFCKATDNKLETATKVLTELKEMKAMKGTPFFAIRRAIKLQENIIKDLKS
jgi:hypothetical protein